MAQLRDAASETIVPRSGLVDSKPGRLVIIGSGIKAIGQFTLEAVAHLRDADRIYFCVADPATELWLLEQFPVRSTFTTCMPMGKDAMTRTCRWLRNC